MSAFLTTLSSPNCCVYKKSTRESTRARHCVFIKLSNKCHFPFLFLHQVQPQWNWRNIIALWKKNMPRLKHKLSRVGLWTHIFRMKISFFAALRTFLPSFFRNFLQVYIFDVVLSLARKISQNSSLWKEQTNEHWRENSNKWTSLSLKLCNCKASFLYLRKSLRKSSKYFGSKIKKNLKST